MDNGMLEHDIIDTSAETGSFLHATSKDIG